MLIQKENFYHWVRESCDADLRFSGIYICLDLRGDLPPFMSNEETLVDIAKAGKVFVRFKLIPESALYFIAKWT